MPQLKGGKGSTLSSLKLPFRRLKMTSDVTLDVHDPPVLFADANGAGRTINLPDPAESGGLIFIIMKYEGGAGQLSIRSAGQTVITLNDSGGGSGENQQCGLVACDGQHWLGFRARGRPDA